MAEKILRIPRWEISVTGAWNVDSGILLLRDKTVEELTDLLRDCGNYVQQTGVMEILEHGSPRKAAELARRLVGDHPEYQMLYAHFGEGVNRLLFSTPLDNLPNSPSEYPPQMKIEYEQ